MLLGMSNPPSIRLSARLRQELERLSKRQQRPLNQVAREAVQRYIAIEKFRALRTRALPLAEAQGLLTDEDVFKAVS